MTHNLVLDTIGFTPGTHYPCIVESNDSHKVNAFRLDLGQVFNEAR